MPWPGIITEGLIPALSIGVVGASIFVAALTKSERPTLQATGIASDSAMIEQMWATGKDKLQQPVQAAFLGEMLDAAGGNWVESQSIPVVIGHSYGKLVVTREFGPSDEADAEDVIDQPAEHLVAVTMGFRPFAGSNGWVSACFSPNGALLEATREMPTTHQVTAAAAAQCEALLLREGAARG